MQPVIDWLLGGDPAIRWQVERDLLGMDRGNYAQERARISSAGWGKRLLAKQDADGNWGGGIYSPKWTSTTYTLLLLRDLGLPQENSQAQRACRNFFLRGLEHDGGINLFKSVDYSEMCVNGMILSLLSYFRSPDPRVRNVAEFVLSSQMPDGGWNCRQGATHASFHTTVSVLEGLREYRGLAGTVPSSFGEATNRGHEFLLAHQLYKSHRTGRVVDSAMTRLHFPPRWHYDILRALDYFRSVGAACDKRMSSAVELLRSRRSVDSRWTLNKPWTGRVYFELEPAGRPSRWNTLRALRVLKWWDRS
jgi:hypothetical protein